MSPHFSTLPGIACIALSFVDPHGRPLLAPAQDYAEGQRSEISTSPFHPHQFDELTSVSKVCSINSSSAAGRFYRCRIIITMRRPVNINNAAGKSGSIRLFIGGLLTVEKQQVNLMVGLS